MGHVATSAATLALFGGGCAGAIDDGANPQNADGDVGVITQAIASESDGATIVGRTLMDHPGRQRAKYATGRYLGHGLSCTGTMIGPNVMITAAHCGIGDDPQIEFIMYNGGATAPTQVRTERFECDYLVDTFAQTDLLLHYCQPNAWGESPGDKYGYLDMEPRNLAANEAVYSIWWNAVDDVSNNHLLYSAGSLGSFETGRWFSPATIDTSLPSWGQCDSSRDDASVTPSWSMVSAPGCSGATILSATTNRIIGGPVSTAGSDARSSVSIRDALRRTVVHTTGSACEDSRLAPMVNEPFLASFNLEADDFLGYSDADTDGVFDVQAAIEAENGEHTRPFYMLSFDSPRQNELWTLPSWTTMGGANLIANGGEPNLWMTHATHDKLNLKADTSYHLSYGVRSTRGFAVCLGASCTTHAATPNGGWARLSTILPSGTGSLRIRAFGPGTTVLSDIRVAEVGATMRLQNFDERRAWLAPNADSRSNEAEFLPRGADAPGDTDFAGLVRSPISSGYTFEGMGLPFRAGENRVCFDVAGNDFDGRTGTWLVQVLEGGLNRVRNSIVPQSLSFNRVCTSWFTLTTHEALLRFGIDQAGFRTSFLIDNLTIETR